MNNTVNLIENIENNTNESTPSPTTSGVVTNDDGSWSRADIMALAFGLVTVVLTVFAAWIAWVGFIKDKRKERKKSKSRRKADRVERAEEVSRRADRVERDKGDEEIMMKGLKKTVKSIASSTDNQQQGDEIEITEE